MNEEKPNPSFPRTTFNVQPTAPASMLPGPPSHHPASLSLQPPERQKLNTHKPQHAQSLRTQTNTHTRVHPRPPFPPPSLLLAPTHHPLTYLVRPAISLLPPALHHKRALDPLQPRDLHIKVRRALVTCSLWRCQVLEHYSVHHSCVSLD